MIVSPSIPISFRFRPIRSTFLNMRPIFWIRRFFLVYLGGFAVLVVAGLIRSRPWEVVLGDSALWAGLAAGLFIATRLYHSRKGRHCALCRDMPESARDSGPACPR